MVQQVAPGKARSEKWNLIQIYLSLLIYIALQGGDIKRIFKFELDGYTWIFCGTLLSS